MDEPSIAPRSSRARLLKSLAGLLAGVLLGLFSYSNLEHGLTASLFVGVVGAFVGIALAQPGVSAARVMRGTAGGIVGYNVPFIGKAIIKKSFEDQEEQPPPADGKAASQRDRATDPKRP